jgi:hypothetical protein
MFSPVKNFPDRSQKPLESKLIHIFSNTISAEPLSKAYSIKNMGFELFFFLANDGAYFENAWYPMAFR